MGIGMTMPTPELLLPEPLDEPPLPLWSPFVFPFPLLPPPVSVVPSIVPAVKCEFDVLYADASCVITEVAAVFFAAMSSEAALDATYDAPPVAMARPHSSTGLLLMAARSCSAWLGGLGMFCCAQDSDWLA
jgi:hypothetical protein